MTRLCDIRFWSLPLQIGVPIFAYGFKNFKGSTCVESDYYVFAADPDVDCFLLPDGKLLPICCATLYDSKGNEIPFDSFSISIVNDYVQINKRVDKGRGYSCKVLKVDEVFIDGDSYDPEDE